MQRILRKRSELLEVIEVVDIQLFGLELDFHKNTIIWTSTDSWGFLVLICCGA